MKKMGFSNFETAEVTFVSNDKVQLNEDELDKFMNSIEEFEDHDDIQAVYHNVDIDTIKE